MFLSLIHQREFFIDVERSAAESSGQHQSRALISRVLSTAEQSLKQSHKRSRVRPSVFSIFYILSLIMISYSNTREPWYLYICFTQPIIVAEDDMQYCRMKWTEGQLTMQVLLSLSWCKHYFVMLSERLIVVVRQMFS